MMRFGREGAQLNQTVADHRKQVRWSEFRFLVLLVVFLGLAFFSARAFMTTLAEIEPVVLESNPAHVALDPRILTTRSDTILDKLGSGELERSIRVEKMMMKALESDSRAVVTRLANIRENALARVERDREKLGARPDDPDALPAWTLAMSQLESAKRLARAQHDSALAKLNETLTEKAQRAKRYFPDFEPEL